jgi:hypothetical protein
MANGESRVKAGGQQQFPACPRVRMNKYFMVQQLLPVW